MKILVLFVCILLILGSCKKNKIELSIQEQDSIRSIFEKNQEIQEFLLQNDSALPSLEPLKDSIIQAKSKVQKSEILHLLSSLENSLQNYSLSEKEKAFNSLSNFSEELYKLAVLVNLQEYNKFFCPMVSKYWVSKGESISNPYSPEMRECGELVR